MIITNNVQIQDTNINIGGVLNTKKNKINKYIKKNKLNDVTCFVIHYSITVSYPKDILEIHKNKIEEILKLII